MAERPEGAAPHAAAAQHDVLLATKFHVPRAQPGLVPRPRLAEQLDQDLRRGLLLVCAPAGYGKTSVLAEWARREAQPAAWLSLDEGDNDPARFWRHVVAALDQVRPGLAERVNPLLGPPSPASFEPPVTALINALAAEPEAASLLVLDDYHLVGSPLVHESLGFLLEHRPAGLRLVLASRTDPPLALARLRVRGQLAELRAAELRFTADEAAALLRRVLAVPGQPLPDAVTAALVARTEGWAAGLQLAALSLRGQSDVEGFVAAFTGSHRYVLDYLAWLHQATGDPVAAMAAMDEAAQVSLGSPGVLNPVPAQRARLLLAQGDLAAAARWTREASLSPDDEPSYPREPGHLMLARVLLAQGRPDQALALLDRLQATAAAQNRTGSLIETGALRALALAAAGDEAQAIGALAGVLRLACGQGYVRVFADEGAPMAALLSRLITAQRAGHAAAAAVPLSCLARLQDAFSGDPRPPDPGPGAAAMLPGIVEPLTARETQVLTMLAAGKPNQAIAGELVVTLDTVKKHVSHVLGKLGAANRTEAVGRARELGLIPLAAGPGDPGRGRGPGWPRVIERAGPGSRPAAGPPPRPADHPRWSAGTASRTSGALLPSSNRPGRRTRYRPRPDSTLSRRRVNGCGRRSGTGRTGAQGKAEVATPFVAIGPSTAEISWNTTTLPRSDGLSHSAS